VTERQLSVERSPPEHSLNDMVTLDRLALTGVFTSGRKDRERLGVEVELAVVDPETGLSLPYEGRRGARALLETVMKLTGGSPVMDGSYLTGIRRDDGSAISLEHNGAIEYSSPPVERLAELARMTDHEIMTLARIADRMNVALLTGGNLPFNSLGDVTWIPKRRSKIMRDYFTRLGGARVGTPPVTTRTLSTQVTVDYLSESDWRSKYVMQTLVTPVAAAIFVNSPIEEGKLSGLMSNRLQYWHELPQLRCGAPEVAWTEGVGFQQFTDWAASMPMVYRLRNGEYAPAPCAPFERLMSEGFGDDTFPTMSDWKSLLSQIWTDVRVRDTLELRVMGGTPFECISAVPAFWSGLTYHMESRMAATEILRGRTVDDYRTAMHQVPQLGLSASYGSDRIGDLAAELVQLAKTGLLARVALGIEQPEAVDLLTPLEEIVQTGATFAERQAARWRTEFEMRPSRFVAAMRVPPG